MSDRPVPDTSGASVGAFAESHVVAIGIGIGYGINIGDCWYETLDWGLLQLQQKHLCCLLSA